MKEGEEKLVESAKGGDERAFGVLYDTYMPPIYRYIFLRVGMRKPDAEDLSHQVFLNAWQNIKRFEFQGFPFSSWLYRIAHNTVIDYYRTHKGHINLESVPEEHIAEFANLESQLDQALEIKLIKTNLPKLDIDQQNVLIMKFVNDLSNKEIAQITGKSEGAIRVIQHRALKQLKTHVDDTRQHNTRTREA